MVLLPADCQVAIVIPWVRSAMIVTQPLTGRITLLIAYQHRRLIRRQVVVEAQHPIRRQVEAQHPIQRQYQVVEVERRVVVE